MYCLYVLYKYLLKNATSRQKNCAQTAYAVHMPYTKRDKLYSINAQHLRFK